MLLEKDRMSDRIVEVSLHELAPFPFFLNPCWVPWSSKFEERQRRMVLGFEDLGVFDFEDI